MILKNPTENTKKISTLNELSRLYRLSGDYERTLYYTNIALALADKLHYIKGKAWTYNIIGAVNRDKGNYIEALRYYQESLQIMQEAGDKNGIAAAFHNIGIIYQEQGNYRGALESHLSSLKVKMETGNLRGMSISYVNIGNVYYDQGNYAEALEKYLAALRINEELGNKGGISSSYNNIGLVYMSLKNYDEAMKNFKAALKLKEEIGDQRTIAGAYHNIGVAFEKLGNYPDALQSHFASLKIKETLGDKRGLANSYDAMGSIYNLTGNYAEAINSHQASFRIREEIGDKEGIAISQINIGYDIFKQSSFENIGASSEKLDEALQLLEKGLWLAKEIGIKETIKDAYGYLAEIYKGMKDYEKAFEYNTLYVELKDSLINNETTRKLEDLRTHYEVEKAVGEEKAKQEKAIAIEKVKYELGISEERALKEKKIAEEKYYSETKLTEEKAKHQEELAKEKIKQEQKIAEARILLEQEKTVRKRRSVLLISGFSIAGIIAFFLVLLIRQKNLKKIAVGKAEDAHHMIELELQSLRAQLNPHFMFNSLNAIQDLILKEDNRSSHRYLSRFSKLLRMLLDNANLPFIPLKKEIDFLELYLSLENLRIPDLQHAIHVDPDIDAEVTMIPNMMLQPYIENAIWHGLSHKTGDKKLEVNIHKENGSIQCNIEDNGVGRKKAEELKSQYRKEHRSKGMELLSKRFNLLSKEYGTAIQTRVIDLFNNGYASGTLVEIIVPASLTKKTKEALYDQDYHN